MGAASEEFRKLLKSGKIVDALTLALGEAIELNITTSVSPVDATTAPLPGYTMKTRINLVDGDIENEIGSQFVGDGPYTELREFHLQQVQEGQHIIQQNIESLQQMFGLLATTVSRLPNKSTNPQQVLTPGSNS